ncbi:MAG: hypothetical protein PVF63_02205 [Gammaproteobacteria bacterium]|jgi:hypothetical protein
MKTKHIVAAAIATSLLAGNLTLAQFGPPPAPDPNEAPRERAPVDLTGMWVAPVMEDWRWRMVTPLKGDAASIPVRGSARAEIESWDPAADEAAGQACKGYGAAAIMRHPGRIRIEWEDDKTLVIEKDYGMQTRRLHFDTPPTGAPTRQGSSAAHWDRGLDSPAPGLGFSLGLGPKLGATSKTLIVETTNLLPGYLRKNGIPHSGAATMMEYYDTFTAVDGTQWFTITTVIEDPEYLAVPFVTTTDYKREQDESRWNPEPCSAY